jgi:hypothetical protein
VEPTTSEKRNVTVPVGAFSARPDIAQAYVRVRRSVLLNLMYETSTIRASRGFFIGDT